MTVYIPATSVFVTFDFVGFHRWPDAPLEVEYLRDRHRHLFKCRVDIAVESQDRQIEYHMLKRAILDEMAVHNGTGVLSGFGYEFELLSNSCEAIAGWLLELVRLVQPDRPYYRVEVSEDGENGSIVEERAA